MTHDTLCPDERLFDPPCLGVPADATALGHAADETGLFVKVFLSAEAGRITQAGFLTDPSGACLAAASLWCESCQGKTFAQALQVTPEELCALPAKPGANTHARLCVLAGRSAVRACIRQQAQGQQPPHKHDHDRTR